MGRIKPAMVKRTAEKLLEKVGDLFTGDFENNKKVLGSTLPSKSVRNKTAGYLARLKKANAKK